MEGQLICFLCKKSDGNIMLFSKGTLKKCQTILKARKIHNLKYNSVTLPNEYTDGDSRPNEQTHKPQDVIKTTYSQVKAYQLADCASSGKTVSKEFHKMPVYGSSKEKVSKVTTNKFETQCVLDTQIIDIIDGAAVINTTTGMTQEFDTTFSHTDDIDNYNSKYELENHPSTQPQMTEDNNHVVQGEIKLNSVTKSNKNSITATQDSQNTEKIEEELDQHIAILSPEDSIKYNSLLYETDTADTITFIENLTMPHEVDEEVKKINDSREMDTDETICLTQNDIDTGQDKELTPSPVLQMKTLNRKLKIPPPLVVSLEEFENFENFAMPLIEDKDFETAKHLINSQIIGKELCFNEHAEVLFGLERDDSPVLDFKSDELKISSDELMPPKRTDNLVKDIENGSKKRFEILEDEILFSSDEEDFSDKELQSLPLTCALKTSSPEPQIEILEKSMYVGFQTASNKSIQICRNSYEQAQSILRDDNGKECNELALNELVEKCDFLRRKAETNSKTEIREIKPMKLKSLSDNKSSEEQNYRNKQIAAIEASKICQDTNSSAQILKEKLKEGHLDGFITASNKKIVMSDTALQRCQNVFKDIDLNNDVLKKSDLKVANEKYRSDRLENMVDITIEASSDNKINDELLLQEFENIEMSLEEKESKDKEYAANEGIKKITDDNIILEETMTKSKNIFADIPIKVNEQTEDAKTDSTILIKLNSVNDVHQPSESLKFVGFKTATNKEIKISDESFAKTKDVFKDIGKDKHKMKSFEEIISQPSTSSMFVGFKTAGNKSIKISSDALSNSKDIFKDIDKEQTKSDIFDYRPLATKTVVSNMHRSTPKKSKASLSKSESKFLNDFTEKIFIFSEFEEPEPAFRGFESPSTKNIDIPDIATENRRKLFNLIDSNVFTKNIPKENEANNIISKNISTVPTDVSKNNNNKLSNTGLQNIDQEIKIYEKNDDNSLFKGFQTASKKPVTVSSDALARSKRLFQDIEETNCVAQKKSSKNIENAFIISKNPCVSPANFSNKTFCNNEQNDDNTIFKGFQTASKKPFTISEDALARSKIVFRDIDKDQDIVLKNASENIPIISEEVSQNNKNKPDLESLKKAHSSFKGFQTASNKPVTISADALARTKIIFKDIDKDQDIVPKNASESTSIIPAEVAKNNKSKYSNLESLKDANSSFKGFQTANNKPVTISEDALARTKIIFRDIDKDNASENIPIISKEVSHNNKNKLDLESLKKTDSLFKGFQTANNKPVTISEDALARTKIIFRDIDKDNASENIPIISEEVSQNNKNKPDLESLKKTDSLFKGFQTASNKRVIVSADALARSKIIFQDVDEVDDITTNEIPENTSEITANESVHNINKFSVFNPIDTIQFCNNEEKDSNFLLKGFETASKKPIRVSADAFIKGKHIFKDIDESNDVIFQKYQGFQRPNKKSAEVNKDALIASKELLSNLSDDQNSKNTKNIFAGFITASNKKVHITDEALVRCKKILDDIEDLPIRVQGTELEPEEIMFKGFLTANKKEIKISKEALKKSKIFLDDMKISSEKYAQKPFGFQTANNDKVIISEQSLDKSRQLFQDINTENIINIPKQSNVPSYCGATEKNTAQDNFALKSSRNQHMKVSEGYTIAKKMFTEKDTKHITDDKNTELTFETNKDFAQIDNMLDTQVINDFKEDMCTEDFNHMSKPVKRSGSPILMCLKAKKRKKFETPYANKLKITEEVYKNPSAIKPTEITFREDYKTNKKYTLKDMSEIEMGKIERTNIDPYILSFKLENMLQFEFDENRNEIKDGKMTIDDVKQLFTKATDAKLIPDGWLDIHLKLIIWKLISYEIRFSNALGKVCTVKNVIDQLKFRYDKELYNAERSVLRKILEKDDVPNKTMVLCVAAIYVDGESVIRATNLTNIELLLTDGWYFIKATIDKMLSKLVFDEKIAVGSKIVTCGAELLNCEQGVAPWEDTSSIRLSISGNSTHPARWDEKLGLRPCTMLSRLSSVRVGGGKVGRLRLRVVRVYPRLYVEKFQDGSTVTRSERLEHQYQMKYEAEREAMIEKIYEEVEKEMSDQDSQDSESLSEKRKCCDSGSQIAKMMKTSKDPMEFRVQLTSSQVHLLQDHVSKQRDRYLQAIQDRVQERLHARNVVTLARGRVVDLQRDGNKIHVTKGMLSIWKPNDEVLDIFREGSWIEVTNMVPTALRNSEIQLSAGRQSVFRPVKCKEDDFKPYLISLSRTCHSIKDLSQNPSMTTEYNEIDTVGMIFSIDPSNRDFDSNKNQFQNVYLADVDKNMIAVNFWGGIKKFGYENILDTGQVIYCGNLQKRAGNTRKNIPQFRATEFAIFTKTPRNGQGREMVDEMNKKMFGLDRRRFCEDCVAVKQNYSVIRCLSDSENVSPYRFDKSDYNLARNKAFIETPVVKLKSKAEDFNLTGLDFESTFKQQDTQLSPKTLERKKKVNEKIAKLKMYGEPPPLSPMNIINKSKNATSSYKSPLLKSEDTSNDASVTSVNKIQDVATPTKLSEDCGKIDDLVSSPIISNISNNRTYVKRSINPVKLSFSENITEEKLNVDRTVDHFAEDFEGSPPLSLE